MFKTGKVSERSRLQWPSSAYSFENLSKSLDPKCDISVGKALQQGEDRKQGYQGGNLQTFDHCVVGDDSLTSDERRKYAAQFCGKEKNLLYAPSFFTQVSHANELYEVIAIPKSATTLQLCGDGFIARKKP